MKLHYLLFSCCFLLSIAGFSQQFEGIATYKTHRDLDLKLDSTQVSSEMQQQLEAQLRKQFQKEYTLTFSTTESQSGSDVAGIRTRAKKVDGGYSIAGSKIWCTDITRRHNWN